MRAVLRVILPDKKFRISVTTCTVSDKSLMYVVLQESFVNEALSEMEGSTVGDMFDFLSKEIIRLQVKLIM